MGDDYTIGSLYVNDVKLCDTIEDKVRDLNHDGDLLDEGEGKVFGETAIPYGIYKVVLSMSPKFKRLLPLIIGVKHFTGIRIHRMRTAKDSHGCVGPGENKIKGGVIDSTDYEMKIVEFMFDAAVKHDPVTIEII